MPSIPGPIPGALSLLIALALAASAHPLDPLTREEITTAVSLLRSQHHLSPSTTFPLIELAEPVKADVLAGRPTSRSVRIVVYERSLNQTFESVVDLKSRRVASWNQVKDVQPPIMPEDFALANQIVRGYSPWQKGLLSRGIKDFNKVQIDLWGVGNFADGGPHNHRLVRTVSYYKGDEAVAYFHPVEGLTALVDLTAGKVLNLIDTGGLPMTKPPVLQNANVETPKPLHVSQPEGVSFRLSGNEISWDNWRFSFALHPRQGLELYNVGYLEHGLLNGSARSILYKAGLSEMVVPYGDSEPAWNFRNSFDLSEYSYVTRSTIPLVPGGDVPENAVFANATFADEQGNAYTVPNAIAIYERDGGILWRYSDLGTGKVNAGRSRELVIANVISASPYEYGFNWVFHQDGRIGMEVLLTGIMATKETLPRASHSHDQGHRVAPDLEAVHHQHFFNFRIDMDVDGTENSVVEVDTSSGTNSPANPNGNAIDTKETVIAKEQDGKRLVNPAASRVWKVINPSRKNAIGEPVGYLLIPGDNSPPYALPSSSVRQRAAFLDAQLWVTRYDPAEQYAAGSYVNQSKGGDGLPKWVSANRKIDNQDVVLWYTLGITHIPRPEEWPIMPVHKAGFELVPSGFFRSNPALTQQEIDH